MYCKKCGAQLNDEAKFCIKCGQPMGQQNNAILNGKNVNGYQQIPHPYQDNIRGYSHGKSKKLWIGIGAGVIVMAIVVVLILRFTSNPTFKMKGYEKPIYYLMQFMETGDIQSLVKTMPLKQLVESAEDEGGKLSEFQDSDLDLDNYEAAIDSLDMIWDGYHDELEDGYGKNIKVSYKIKSAEKLDDWDDIQDEYDALNIDIKAVYNLTVRMTIEGDDDEDTETSDITVLKIGSKWYLDIFGM